MHYEREERFIYIPLFEQPTFINEIIYLCTGIYKKMIFDHKSTQMAKAFLEKDKVKIQNVSINLHTEHTAPEPGRKLKKIVGK